MYEFERFYLKLDGDILRHYNLSGTAIYHFGKNADSLLLSPISE